MVESHNWTSVFSPQRDADDLVFACKVEQAKVQSV